MNTFLDLFSVSKPVITVLHGRGGTDAQILENAKREVETFMDHGVNALLVENYFCTPAQAEMVLEYVTTLRGQIPFGVNLLGDDALNFELARKYDCDFMQLDSVAGHLPPDEDQPFGDWIAARRAEMQAKLIGGVRFKYQKYLSGRTLEEDLHIGVQRCDAIAVTGDYTGQETDMEKIREFRRLVTDAPLIIAAGVTPRNAGAQLAYGDACIIGSYFKENHDVQEAVNEQYVLDFMRAIRAIREA